MKGALPIQVKVFRQAWLLVDFGYLTTKGLPKYTIKQVEIKGGRKYYGPSIYLTKVSKLTEKRVSSSEEKPKMLYLIGQSLCLQVELYVQFDEINMAVFFWYLVKIDLSSVRYCTRIHWTSYFLQGSIKTRPCINLGDGHELHNLTIKA